jgi:hypothetical protein
MAESRKIEGIDYIEQFLLGYTYFLIDKNTAYIIIGYNCNTFKTTILIVKKNSSVVFDIEKWKNLYEHMEFMINAKKFHDCLAVCFKKSKNGKIAIEITEDGIKKVVLDLLEWTKWTELSPFLHSVLSWYDLFNNEIENYYKQYLAKCKEKEVQKLKSSEFFVPHQITYNYWKELGFWNRKHQNFSVRITVQQPKNRIGLTMRVW